MFGIGAICSCQQVYAETTKRSLITLHAKSWSVCKIEVIVKVWWGSRSLLGNPSLFFAEDVLSECPSRFKLWCWIYRINGVGSPVLISSFCFLVIFLCSLKHTMCFICSFISFKALFFMSLFQCESFYCKYCIWCCALRHFMCFSEGCTVRFLHLMFTFTRSLEAFVICALKGGVQALQSRNGLTCFKV